MDLQTRLFFTLFNIVFFNVSINKTPIKVGVSYNGLPTGVI